MQPAVKTEKPPPKRLALFLDGTWNTTNTNTNVWRMRSLCADKDDSGIRQLRYYDAGVNGVRGGGWGEGLSENILEAYNWLVENYEFDDQIFIFGFSRGAYTARSLAGFVAMCGLLKPGGALGVSQLFDRYRRAEEQERTIYKIMGLSDLSAEEKWMLKYSRAVPIQMVGVWDTVGAIGIPAGNIKGISSSTFGFLHTGLRQSIKHAFHAVAIDEHRPKFKPTLWTVRVKPGEQRKQPRAIESVEQRWFIGAHGNVGGGYYTDLLPQIPLRWMMKKASLCGLVFRNDLEVDEGEPQGRIDDSFKDFLGGWYSRLYGRYHRPIEEQPMATPRGTHYTVNETIDGSVFERWRANDKYRPPSVVRWASGRGVDPAKLLGAVRADNPSQSVAD